MTETHIIAYKHSEGVYHARRLGIPRSHIHVTHQTLRGFSKDTEFVCVGQYWLMSDAMLHEVGMLKAMGYKVRNDNHM